MFNLGLESIVKRFTLLISTQKSGNWWIISMLIGIAMQFLLWNLICADKSTYEYIEQNKYTYIRLHDVQM